jgi:hypothetical protein
VASRNVLLTVALVVGLLVGAGVTYAYGQSQISSLQSSLSQADSSNSVLSAQASSTQVIALQPQSGQMIHDGWVIIASIGGGDYVVSLYAQGLESSSTGAYIVEGVQLAGSMNMAPIGPNATASEFEAASDGSGSYWTVLMQNPTSSFEAIDLVFLPGMNMSQAAVVGTAQL